MRASAVALLLCTACTMPIGVPQPAGGTDVPAATPDATLARVAQDVIDAVNATRRSNDAGALIEDPVLSRAAQGHSEELARRGQLDHNSTDPSRRTMTMRIEAAGGTWSRAAENLANMSGPASNVPAQTVQMWLSSDGHRRNMLTPDYTHTGVGVAIDRRGYWYVTQLYVIPRSR